MLSAAAVALAALAVLSVAGGAEAIRWRKNPDGEVVRLLVPLRAPSPIRRPGQPGYNERDILLFAGRKGDRFSDALFWHWTTNAVPRKAVLYFKKKNDEEDAGPADENENQNEAPSAAALFFRVGLWKLVEYEDRDGTAGYDPVATQTATSDRPVQQMVFWNGGALVNPWTPFQVRVSTADGRQYKAIKVCTTLDGANDNRTNNTAVIDICVQWTGPRQRIEAGDAQETDPNAAKWSLRVRNWDWAGPATSKLALKVSVDTVSAARDADAEVRAEAAQENSDALDVGGADDGAQAVATWVRDVDISGGNCPAGTTQAPVTKGIFVDRDFSGDSDVSANAPPDDGISFVREVQVAYFNFETTCHPADIFWDPEMGVVTVDAAPTTAATLALIAAVLALLF